MDWISSYGLFFVLPIIVFAIFLILSCCNWFERIDKRIIRRIYYFLCLLWIAVFMVIFCEKLKCTDGSNGIDIQKTITNISLCFGLLLAAFVLWDILFISSKTINSLTLKDLSINVAEYNEIKKTTESKTEDLELLDKILKIEYTLIREMPDFISRIDIIDDERLYEGILSKYARLRKNIAISLYPNSDSGLRRLKERYRLNDMDFSSIQHCLDLNGICLPSNCTGKERIYVVFRTRFTVEDVVAVINAKRIVRNEHLIIQNIISWFDHTIELEIKQLAIDDLTNHDPGDYTPD